MSDPQNDTTLDSDAEEVPWGDPVKPAAAFWAGLGWTCFGACCLVVCLALVAYLVLASSPTANPRAQEWKDFLIGIAAIGAILSGALGTLFLFLGIPVMRYRARGVLLPACVSFVTSGLFLSFAAFEMITSVLSPRPGRGSPIGPMVEFMIAVGLAVCGLVALSDRSKYLAFRAARTAPARRPIDEHRPRYRNPWPDA